MPINFNPVKLVQNAVVNQFITVPNFKGNDNAVDNKGLGADTVQLSKAAQTAPEVKSNDEIRAKMAEAVNKILDEKNLQKGQPVVLKADKTQVPFLEVFAEQAYKRGSGHVVFEVAQPEFDALREKYCTEPDFAWKASKDAYLKEKNAIVLDFNEKSGYDAAGLSKAEAAAMKKTVAVEIPKNVEEKLGEAFNEKEIFHTLLNVQKGQPITVSAEREHEARVAKFVEYAYKTAPDRYR